VRRQEGHRRDGVGLRGQTFVVSYISASRII